MLTLVWKNIPNSTIMNAPTMLTTISDNES